MEKKQFLQMVGQKLADQVSEWKIAVSARTVMKNNGVCKEGLTVCIEDDAVNPTLYLEQEYDDFMSGTCSIEEIVEKVHTFLVQNRQEARDFPMEMLDYENAKKQICYRLISGRLNKKMLEEVPYVPFLDLAIVFYLVIEKNKQGVNSVCITNELMKRWQVGIRQLYKQARENTKRIFRLKLQNMMDLIRKDMSPESIEELGPGLDSSMWVLTNELGIYGATTMLYDGVLEEAGEKWEQNFYIIPSSVHELILLPEEWDMEQLDLMIKEVNEREVKDDEILSDHAYLYDVKEKRFYF